MERLRNYVSVSEIKSKDKKKIYQSHPHTDTIRIGNLRFSFFQYKEWVQKALFEVTLSFFTLPILNIG